MNDQPTSQFPLKIIILFLIMTSALFAMDYDHEYGLTFPGKAFLGNTIRSFIRESTLTPEIVARTSLKDHVISSLPSRKTFFDPYLQLPADASASFFELKETSILITEVFSGNAFQTIETLLRETSPDYEFNIIHDGAFYLNQIPPEKKSANFLGILIKDVVYGFQYQPADHQKVLEIIDSLSELQ